MAATLTGLGPIGPIADHRIAAGNRHVGDRQAIHVDADGAKVVGNQMTCEASDLEPDGLVPVVKRAIARTRRIGRPMRRTQALHPAALLIDQNGRMPADHIAE